MNSAANSHQNPLVFIAIFLVLALGALALVVAQRPSDGAVTAEPPQTGSDFDCPRGTPEGFAISDVEGQTLPELEQWATQQGMTVRAVVVDGKPKAVTMDYNPQRINVQLESGTVVRYCGNG